MHRLISGVLSIGIALLSIPTYGNPQPSPDSIVFCDRVGSADRESIISTLSNRHSVVKVDCNTASPAESQVFVALSFDDAAELLSNESLTSAPIVIANVYRDSLSDLFSGNERQNIYTFFSDPDPRQQLLLSKEILSSDPSLLLIYTKATRDIASQYAIASKSLGVDLRPVIANDEKDALKAIIENSDAHGVVLIPDKRIYTRSTLPTIMRMTYKLGIPLIGFAPSIVQSGALATTFPSRRSIISFVSSVVDGHAQNNSLSLTPTIEGNHSLAINRVVARSLNLNIAEKHILINNIQSWEQ